MGLSATFISSATSFLAALGVNVHLDNASTVDTNTAMVESALSYVGITLVRDSLPQSGAAALAPYAALAARGIRFDLVTAVGGAPSVPAVIAQLTAFNAAFPGSLAAIEGANEANLWPITYGGSTSVAAAAAYQVALYQAVVATASLAQTPVYNMTLGGGSTAQYAALGNLSTAADMGNAHIYPQGGTIPGAPGPYIAVTIPWETPDTPTLPTVITEGGYYTMPTSGGAGVDQDVQAKYTLDYLFDAAMDGARATYIYELLDDAADPDGTNMEDHFGLFTYTGAPKRAAVALRHLVLILSRQGTGSLGTAPAYSLIGLPATGNSLVLEKNGGAFDIVVWNEPQIWNPTTATEMTAASVSVAVALGQTAASVKVYDPMIGIAAQQSLTKTASVTLKLTDHPLIVEVTP